LPLWSLRHPRNLQILILINKLLDFLIIYYFLIIKGTIYDLGGWIYFSIIANFDNINKLLRWIAIFKSCIINPIIILPVLDKINYRSITGGF
jgi:hypothetical protein